MGWLGRENRYVESGGIQDRSTGGRFEVVLRIVGRNGFRLVV